MKTSSRALFLVLAFSVATSGAGLAQPAGQQQGQHQQGQPQQGQPQQQKPQQAQQKPQQAPQKAPQQKQAARPEFRAQDSRAVRSYFHDHRQAPAALPHGTKLVVGQKRPPNVEYRDLPPSLLRQLPANDGYRYYLAGDDVILVAILTGVIVDILVSVH